MSAYHFACLYMFLHESITLLLSYGRPRYAYKPTDAFNNMLEDIYRILTYQHRYFGYNHLDFDVD